MLEFAKKYSRNVYSQNGEDGIIAEILARTGLLKGVCIEFGAADGFFCSNTRNLINNGWKGYLYDMEAKGDVEAKMITPENADELPACNVLSIDIDGNDYNVWKAYEGKPAIVVIEINSSIHPLADGPVSDSEKGTGYGPMVELGISKGYFLLCHTGNLIFVDEKYKKLFPEVKGDPIKDSEKYFNNSWLH